MELLPPKLGTGQPRAPLMPFASVREPEALLQFIPADFVPADDPYSQPGRDQDDINPIERAPKVARSRPARPGDLPLPSNLQPAWDDFQCQRHHSGPRPPYECPSGCRLCQDCLRLLVQESKAVYPRCVCGRVLGLAETRALTS